MFYLNTDNFSWKTYFNSFNNVDSPTFSLLLILLTLWLGSYSTTNKMQLLSQIIYSCKTLYMFRTVFPSIIRSSKLFTQQRHMSNSCCYLLLAAAV